MFVIQKKCFTQKKMMQLISGQQYWLCNGKEYWPLSCYKYDGKMFCGKAVPAIECLRKDPAIGNSVTVETSVGIRHAVLALPPGKYSTSKSRLDVKGVSLQYRNGIWYHVVYLHDKNRLSKAVFTVVGSENGSYTIEHNHGETETWTSRPIGSTVLVTALLPLVVLVLIVMFLGSRRRRHVHNYSMEQIVRSNVELSHADDMPLV